EQGKQRLGLCVPALEQAREPRLRALYLVPRRIQGGIAQAVNARTELARRVAAVRGVRQRIEGRDEQAVARVASAVQRAQPGERGAVIEHETGDEGAARQLSRRRSRSL